MGGLEILLLGGGQCEAEVLGDAGRVPVLHFDYGIGAAVSRHFRQSYFSFLGRGLAAPVLLFAVFVFAIVSHTAGAVLVAGFWSFALISWKRRLVSTISPISHSRKALAVACSFDPFFLTIQ